MSFTKRSADEVQELAVALFEEHGGYLMAIATRNAGGSIPVGEEALQEALISFLRAFDPGRGAPPLAWLTLTLKRECWRRYGRERYDRRANQEAGEDDEPGAIVERLASPGESLEERLAGLHEGRQHLGLLRPDERTGLGLFAAGFSYKEIAARQGWTYTKVNRCITEGRRRLNTGPAALVSTLAEWPK